MLQKHKKLFISLLIVILLGILGGFVLFKSSIRWLEDKVHHGLTDLRKKGYTVSYSTIEIKGTPFAIQAILRNPHLKDPHGLFEWRGQDVKVVMRPWEWLTLHCSFLGEQKIFVPQLSPFSLGVLQFEGAEGVFHLRAAQGHLVDATLTVKRLFSPLITSLHPPFLQEVFLKVGKLETPLALNLSFAAQVRNLEKFFNTNFSSHPLMINLEAHLSGFKSKCLPRSLAEWRDSGGILEVGLLKLSWLPVTIQASGTLTYDKDMYPLGSFVSQITGYEEALKGLVASGLVKKSHAKAAAFALNLLSSSNQKGSPYIEIPITVQNKTFSVGPAPLFRLGPAGIER